MVGKIPERTIDEIRDRTDILSLIGKYVSLRKAGRNFVGLCPFHAEKTPSFSVNPEKGIYKCFGCGKGETPSPSSWKWKGCHLLTPYGTWAVVAGLKSSQVRR